MTIPRRKDLAAQARIGDVVRSVAIGRCPEFVGTIAEVAGWRWLNVRDASGRVWHRSWGDLRDVGEGVAT